VTPQRGRIPTIETLIHAIADRPVAPPNITHIVSKLCVQSFAISIDGYGAGSELKLKGEVLDRAQQLLDQGGSVPEVAEELNVLANAIHKAIQAGIYYCEMVSVTATIV
jgi:hypothetical protein